jgi:hypothetical protein
VKFGGDGGSTIEPRKPRDLGTAEMIVYDESPPYGFYPILHTGSPKNILNLFVVVVVAVWLSQTFGIIGSLKALQVR